ncbi:uncharacterized protein LOC144582765 [Callithrix jacchus]
MASGARGPQAASAQPCDAAWSGAPRAAGGSLKDARHRPQIPSDWCKVEGGRSPLPSGRGPDGSGEVGPSREAGAWRSAAAEPTCPLLSAACARRPPGSLTAAGKIGRGPAREVARAPRICRLAAPDAQDPVSSGIKKNRLGFNINQGNLGASPQNKTYRKCTPEDEVNHPFHSSCSWLHSF